MSHTFFSLREKCPSAAKGDEPHILLPLGEVPERSEGDEGLMNSRSLRPYHERADKQGRASNKTFFSLREKCPSAARAMRAL